MTQGGSPKRAMLTSRCAQYIEKLGPTFVMKMLGTWGIATTDPKNIEAVLSTRFEGARIAKDER